jgi:signal transduction histidine kinase/ActR/RegA family two-component response regulator
MLQDRYIGGRASASAVPHGNDDTLSSLMKSHRAQTHGSAESDVDHGAAPPALVWRRRLLDGLLVAAVALTTISLPAVMIQTGTHQSTRATWIAVGIYLVLLCAALARRQSYTLRALSLLIGLAAVALLGFARVGFQVGPGVGFALTVVLAGLLLGRAALIITYLGAIATIVGVGVWQGATRGAQLAPAVNDPLLLSNWIRAAFAFALFCGVLGVAVMFVVAYVERALEARTRTLERLSSEQRQRERTELALSQANEQIVQMQKLEALGRLAGGVAHDFNNALVVILGWTDLLRDRPREQGALNEALDAIDTAASRAARLTQELLAFGRKAVHVPQNVALSALVPKVIEMLARLLPANVRITSSIDPEVPPVFADPGQIHRLLLNLCLNARDAMPQGGELEIRAFGAHTEGNGRIPAGNWVALSVRDTGVGMDAETQKRAFEPFFTTKGELGNGLGLSSVYGVVQQSGGHVTLESQIGRGTTFTVLLPRGEHELAVEQAQLSPTPADAPALILVAEDEPAVRRVLVEALQTRGHTVLDAPDGGAALELARRHREKIDLLLTDGVMPGISSSQLIAGFRRLFPDAAVLVCSGHVDEQPLRQAIEDHDLKYLRKPFTSHDLNVAIAEALAQARRSG